MREPQPSTEDLVRTLGDLGRGAVPVEDQARAAYRRERVVRGLSRQLASIRDGRPARARLWIAAAAAAFVLAAGGAGYVWLGARDAAAVVAREGVGEVRSVVGAVSIRRAGGAEQSLAAGEMLRGGEAVRTEREARLEIAIETGRALLESASTFEVMPPAPGERRLKLAEGGVDVDLPTKLARGEHLIIETPDAVVIVVGTAFTVNVKKEQDTTVTSVAVRRGTVWVQRGGRQEAILLAGQAWRSREAARENAAERAMPEVEERPAARPVRSRAGGARAAVAPAARPRDTGTLAEENRLFEAGLSARNNGDHVAAAESFRALLSRYPGSVLAEQALAGQFRSLERAGRMSTAVVAARRYLASYPQGFARLDAERIASGSLGDR